MKNNKFIIAAAGSGKTTLLVDRALEINSSKQVLISTYTNENEDEIRTAILRKKKSIPSNITIQGWFSFLLQHGVRPYQGTMDSLLFSNDLKGLLLSEGSSSIKKNSQGEPIYYNGRPVTFGQKDFKNFYFSKNWKIYSDKISKFIVECNDKVEGEIINRLSRIYSHIFIDEVQDLAGFDLEIIKLLFQSDIETTLVGDPRQVTYLTNHYNKYSKYKQGKIKEFLQNECKSLIDDTTIDESILKASHRNNKSICDYSSKLFPQYEKTEPCVCIDCRSNITEHEGVFLVGNEDLEYYLEKYKPLQLIWSKSTEVDSKYPVLTFGKSKGKTYDRVVIYPTVPIKKWICNNESNLTDTARSKFYVALTRARHSVAIVYDINENKQVDSLIKFEPE